jgi:hypothetical protein
MRLVPHATATPERPTCPVRYRSTENRMAEDQDIKDLRNAIGRGLPSWLAVEREMPERLAELLRQLRFAEDRMGKAPDGIR